MSPKTFLPAALIASLAATGALAAFSDTDGDGSMSQDEFVAAFPDGSEDQFTAVDADGDGMISEEEYAAAVEAGVITEE